MKGLSEIFEKNDWSQDPEVLALYGADWTKHYHVKARAVVFPRSEDQVMELVKWARKEKQALVPSGGRTGLSAAAFATSGEVVVSFEKMNKIKEWNAYDQQVICEPGVITENLQNFVLEKGFFFPVDFASRGSSQIGGNVATNAGGIKVIRYGLMRNWVAGLRVVTGRGEILSLNNGLIKNATGYDLRHLFIGSEGTLGFFTEITLSVTLPPSPTQVFVLGIPRLESIMEVYLAFKRKMPLMAVELFTELSTQYVVAQGHVKRPFETQTPYYLLLEIEESFMDEAMTVFESCLEKGNVEDGVISQNKQQAKELWRLREDITEATAHKDPYKNDISVRVSKIPDFLKGLERVIKDKYPHFEVVWFGHIGDGNLHVNILKPDDWSEEKFLAACHETDQEMFKMIQELGGSISAEHGVGLVKKEYLHFSRSKEEICSMKEIKKVFDPDGILNPGKLF